MNTGIFCQSCSMPLDAPGMHGTEKDGSESPVYCRYCYQQGAFVNPSMSLTEMASLVTEQMKKRNIDKKIIDMAVNSLPGLLRWKNQGIGKAAAVKPETVK